MRGFATGPIKMSIFRLLGNDSAVVLWRKIKAKGDDGWWLSVENKPIVHVGGRSNRAFLWVLSSAPYMCFLILCNHHINATSRYYFYSSLQMAELEIRELSGNDTVSVYKSQLKQSFAWNQEGRSDFIYTLVKKEINKLDYVKKSLFFQEVATNIHILKLSGLLFNSKK